MRFLNSSELEQYLLRQHQPRLDVQVAESLYGASHFELQRWATAAAERQGYRVVGVTRGGQEPFYGSMGPGSRYVTLRLERSDAVTPPRSGGPSPEWRACRERLGRFCASLAPFASSSIGQPFGPGLGLEQALALLREHFVSAADVRSADSIVVMDLLEATGEAFEVDELDSVMGLSAIERGEPSRHLAESAGALSAAARLFLGQFDEDGADLWELWKMREDVAFEFLCWHAVAHARLAAMGRLDPL